MLELPDSLVSSHVYEIVKTIYSTANTADNETTRVSVIQSTLGQLRLANIATLDAITTHFSRLIELTSADESYISALTNTLSPCILRPKQETTLTMNEKYSYRLLRDLLSHHDPIFGELKRASSAAQRAATEAPSSATAHSASAAAPKDRGRTRNTSHDESNRRHAEEERRQAIKDRSRATSPVPKDRASIRRERSPHRMSGGPETRFPVAVSGVVQAQGGGFAAAPRGRGQSLEVPEGVSPVALEGPAKQNGAAGGGLVMDGERGVEKKDSLGRGGPRVAQRKAVEGVTTRQSLYGGKKESAGSLKDIVGQQAALYGDEQKQRGVELVDRPMDD